ncbi:hypothetical protein INT46_001884 [Mucor plumbeus]|uniref:Uncharacterized protein n=1 Tax=Mucor plumbeus TaxID=97098 RepID=A0A8H7VAA9_9FUNG|nr:hypothetical protein INT46_001884 [Mucor plumbeus]
MFHKKFKQYLATKLLLLALAATSFGVYAASIPTKKAVASFHDRITVKSSEGFYDETNNRPHIEEVPSFQLPPPVVCSNNCTINSNSFPSRYDNHKHKNYLN